MWGSAPYQRIVDLTSAIHAALIERVPPRLGESWLDVATGTGAVALLAARAGARVTGLDLAPELIETARRKAAEEGLDVRFDVGDAERLPYPDRSFQTVTSSLGVQFAPDHRAAAQELARVTAPGGRLGLAGWTPASSVAETFALMRPFAPLPPPGVGNVFDWGDERYVRGLLGAAFDLELEERDAPQEASSGEELWEIYYGHYGPTRTLADSLDPTRREQLRRALIDHWEESREGDRIRRSRTYLLVVGRRR